MKETLEVWTKEQQRISPKTASKHLPQPRYCVWTKLTVVLLERREPKEICPKTTDPRVLSENGDKRGEEDPSLGDVDELDMLRLSGAAISQCT